MLATLPWRDVAEVDGRPLVVSVTRLRLRRWRDVPAFLVAALRLRRELAAAPGAVTLGLAAQPWRKTFWTLSAWRDTESLTAYVRSPGHAAAMRRFGRHMTDASSARWTTGGGRPSWSEARERLDRRCRTGQTGTTVRADPGLRPTTSGADRSAP